MLKHQKVRYLFKTPLGGTGGRLGPVARAFTYESQVFVSLLNSLRGHSDVPLIFSSHHKTKISFQLILLHFAST